MKVKGLRIFKGSLTDEQKAALKEKFKGIPLFVVQSTDNKGQLHDIVFRPIFHDLYAKIQNMVEEGRSRGTSTSQLEIDDLIMDECLLWPEIALEERPLLEVSVVPSFSKIVQEESGFAEIDVAGNWIGPNHSTIPIKDYEYWGDYTASEVEELKQKVPFQLFRVRIGKFIFITRPLTTQDIRIAQTQPDNSLTLAKASVMWPHHEKLVWNTVPAGIVDTLAMISTKLTSYNSDDVEVQEL